MDRLISPLAKLERAGEHLTAFDQLLARCLQEHPYEVISEENPQSGEKQLRMRIGGHPPLDITLSHLVGEYATALRSSLNHLMWALQIGDPPKPNQIEFPIFDTPGQYTKESARKFGLASDDAKTAIELMQPYHAAEATDPSSVYEILSPNPSHSHPLWRLHRLSNTDKHRIIVVVAAGFRVTFTSMRFGNRAGFTSFRRDANGDLIAPIPSMKLSPHLPAIEFLDILRNAINEDLQVHPLFSIVLKNADTDTGAFMPVDELPSLYDFVGVKVVPTLKGLVP